MISVSDRVAIGNSDDEFLARFCQDKEQRVGVILNVASDLPGTFGSDASTEYMQVGLVDGPGNPVSAYCSAVLALHSALDRHPRVLVCCHTGSRSLAVVVMYLILKGGRTSPHVSVPNRWRTWDDVLTHLREVCGKELPEPHPAHREASDKLPYGILERLT